MIRTGLGRLPLLAVLLVATLPSGAPATSRLNAQTATCLAPTHRLAPNQQWLPLSPAPVSQPVPAVSLSCPVTAPRCYSGDDILPTGKANMTMGSCCDLCKATAPQCVGVVLTKRVGNVGLTCYLKSAMVRGSSGPCTSGAMPGKPLPGPSPPPPPPGPPGPPPALPPALLKPVQLQHRASGLCLEVRQPSGNVEVAKCEPSSAAQLFVFRANGTIATSRGVCLFVNNAHGIDDNVVAANTSCVASTCTPAPACARWDVSGVPGQGEEEGGGERQLFAVALSGGGGQAGRICLDAGSGGNSGDATVDVLFRPVAPAARSGPGQAYCNASAPSWGGGAIKIGSVYHLYVITMAAGSGNDPNRGSNTSGPYPFGKGRIDHATSTRPTGPYSLVQENVIPHNTSFLGNPQIFRSSSGKLLLAVIGQGCAVYSSESADGPWTCANVTTDFNNPTLVPMPNDQVALFCHDCAGDRIQWGDSVSGVMGAVEGPWTVVSSQDDDPTRLGQLFLHPAEDPFAWWDDKARRFRMLTHTFRMGMVCGAGTATACGSGAALGGGEPMGALASSGGPQPFANWTYNEASLAYGWSVPVAGDSGDVKDDEMKVEEEIMRRRERPFLLFDDDGKVYLFTAVSPANTSLHMYTHVQEVKLPAGVGGPAIGSSGRSELHRPADSRLIIKTDDALAAWPNTTDGIHAFVVGDDYARPSSIGHFANRLSFVMRTTQYAAWRSSNNPQLVLASYMPFTRDPAPSCHPQPCNMLPWWQQHKPHLVLYQCDKVTPAWECFGGGISCEAAHLSVPLDLTLPETLQYQMASAVLPAKRRGSNAIELDNYNLFNEWSACGSFSGPGGAWVQRYNSTDPKSDHQYVLDVLNWTKRFVAASHQVGMLVLPNWSVLDYQNNDVAEALALFDGVFAESGFAEWCPIPNTSSFATPPRMTTAPMFDQQVEFIRHLQRLGKAYFAFNGWGPGKLYRTAGWRATHKMLPPVAVQGETHRAIRQFIVASYMIVNGGACAIELTCVGCYAACCGGVGNFSIWPEYSAAVGSPVQMEPRKDQLTGVWSRRYATGFAVVNPANTSQIVALPVAKGEKWTDLYGTGVASTVVLPAASGRVFVLANAA